MSNGPRKQSLYAGLYSTVGLGEVQPPKKNKEGRFFRTKKCYRERHAWIRGSLNWVCSRCGHVASLAQYPEAPPQPEP
jgi:hypothetical protein